MSRILQLLSQKVKREVFPLEFIEVSPDLFFSNDITTGPIIDALTSLSIDHLPFSDRYYVILDHFTPNKDRQTASLCNKILKFAKKFNIKVYQPPAGIEHVLLAESGLIKAEDFVVGADSHSTAYGAIGALSTGMGSTDIAGALLSGKVWLRVPEVMKLTYYGQLNKWVDGKDLILYTLKQLGTCGATYKGVEFCGEAFEKLSLASKFVMCTMAVELGAKFGLAISSSENGSYSKELEFDVSDLSPQIALPHSPDNVKSIDELDEVELSQVVIGSCVGGRFEDLYIAADLLRGHKSKVPLIIIPATINVYKQALKAGLIEVFCESNAIVCPPTCGPCLGGHMGVVAAGDRVLANVPRNFPGRMGEVGSEVYLSNTAVCAASAIMGKITHPQRIKPK